MILPSNLIFGSVACLCQQLLASICLESFFCAWCPVNMISQQLLCVVSSMRACLFVFYSFCIYCGSENNQVQPGKRHSRLPKSHRQCTLQSSAEPDRIQVETFFICLPLSSYIPSSKRLCILACSLCFWARRLWLGHPFLSFLSFFSDLPVGRAWPNG